jgi:hypothetical protein
MSPSDEDRPTEPGPPDDALTEELRRIDAEAEAGDYDDDSLDLRADEDEYDGLIWALPGLTRLALKTWLRTAVWGVEVGVRVSGRLARAAVDPRATVALARDVGAGVRLYAREFLGIADLEQRVDEGRFMAGTGPAAAAAARSRGRGRGGDGRAGDPNPRRPSLSPEDSLRVQGAQLLRESADVSADDRTHPAYARIMAELAPDEGRIMRLLAVDGPQPSVDVRALNLIGVGSQLVAEELSMIGPEAGCRHPDRVPEYLINLQRLALVCFSDQPLEDPIRYQVLEAQPDVLSAIKGASRAKTVHRTLRLTPFGQNFCDVSLPLDLGEVEDLTE